MLRLAQWGNFASEVIQVDFQGNEFERKVIAVDLSRNLRFNVEHYPGP